MERNNHLMQQEEEDRHNVVVRAPLTYQGIGDALRSIFVADSKMLPDDWNILLNKLN